MKTFITFGFDHTHEVEGRVLDKDCVAVIESESAEAGRAKAFELFGPKFCMEYPEPLFTEDKMRFFPRGKIFLGEAA